MVELSLAQIASIATSYNQGRLDYSLSECSFYANLALTEVATRTKHQPLERLAVSSTTSGERRITVPSDFLYPLNVTLSDTSAGPAGSPMQLQAREATWLDSIGTQVGVPRYYIPYADWIELAPSPDSAYSVQVRYGAKIPAMVASTDTPALSERYHYAVALKTAELLAAARNDLEQEAANRVRYLSYIGSTPSDLAMRQSAQEGVGVAMQFRRR